MPRNRQGDWTAHVVSTDDNAYFSPETGTAVPRHVSGQGVESGGPTGADNAEAGDGILLLARIAEALELLNESAARIADGLSPTPPSKVGTPYLADRLGCTTVWVAEQARTGEIPRDCIVPGTGAGKPWKFYRGKIDAWIMSR